ncbi:cobyric acid synthase [Propionibacterium freudenreichii]|uniref:cobyric acid synthase n=2 Tax=Propionibacterium freudenreichii TaxID=1744 RepID=UPI003D70903B
MTKGIPMTGILLTGTSSDAGKSALVTGLCGALRQRGIDVAPFKSQNMSNNSMVCPDSAEIGRAQYLQATAAGVTPEAAMNPVLLKPGTDRRSFIVLMGRPDGELDAGEYATGRKHLAEAAYDAYSDLASRHELIVCEGAGSPAEINLRAGDYVNMGLARHFGLPTVIIGDIDRGGVLASLYGTWALLEAEDRALLKGYIINKFRGDGALLEPGLQEITTRTGLANLGVMPWLEDVWFDGEDALQVDRWPAQSGAGDRLVVAAVRLPRISNSTDIDALATEPGVEVQVTADPATCARADLVVLPGSRATVDDLDWLRKRGIAQAIVQRRREDKPILGICGGFEMMANTIDDDIESSAGSVPGLGVLPARFRFDAEKVVRTAQYHFDELAVDGYEIHHGRFEVDGGEAFLDGVRSGNSFGTMLHGSLENDGFRRRFLHMVARNTGSTWEPDDARPGYQQLRATMIRTLSTAMAEYVDVDAMLAMTGLAR